MESGAIFMLSVVSWMSTEKRLRVWECHSAHFAAAIHLSEWSPSPASDAETCCGLANPGSER